MLSSGLNMIKPIVGIKEGLQMMGRLLGVLTLAHPAAEVLRHVLCWSWLPGLGEVCQNPGNS